MRVAVYYAPTADDPLWIAGCNWLGRDPGAPGGLAQPDVPDIVKVTAEARRYGFHATLKPPMRLATDWYAFMTDARRLAARLRAFALPSLAVTELSGFLALCETSPSPALQTLADTCVAELDVHRAPASPEEVARWRRHGLSPERQTMLLRWGYPDVFASWRFHMTLTRRLRPEEGAILRPAAEAHFAAVLAIPRTVDGIALFVEPEPNADFMLAERLPLRG